MLELSVELYTEQDRFTEYKFSAQLNNMLQKSGIWVIPEMGKVRPLGGDLEQIFWPGGL